MQHYQGLEQNHQNASIISSEKITLKSVQMAAELLYVPRDAQMDPHIVLRTPEALISRPLHLMS